MQPEMPDLPASCKWNLCHIYNLSRIFQVSKGPLTHSCVEVSPDSMTVEGTVKISLVFIYRAVVSSPVAFLGHT